MSVLVIHVGPPKCGSSSIQSFLKKKPFNEKVKFRRITIKIINSFSDSGNGQDKIYKSFIRCLQKDLSRNETVIISHEYLFGQTDVIKDICNLTQADEIKIIGYSRKPSDFLISAYSQWDFRNRESHDFYSNFLKDTINPVFFTGLESFIASIILSDFKSGLKDSRFKVYDWYFYYNEIKEAIPDSKIFVNCLPARTFKYNIISDFCDKAGLTVKKRKQSHFNQKSNIKFDTTLTESIYNSLPLKLNVPNGRFHNFFLEDLSVKLGRNSMHDNNFVTRLANYIDTVFWESNKKLCNTYGISDKEYEPGEIISKEEIIEIINQEYEIRKKSPEELLQYYKNLSGKWAHFYYYSYYENFFNKVPVLSKHLIKYLLRI